MYRILGDWGWPLVGFLIVVTLIGILRFVRIRTANSDAGSMDDMPSEASGAHQRRGLATIYPSLDVLLDDFVLVRAAEHPDWERLDGAVGVPGRQVASFMHHGIAYGVNGASEIAALITIREWMKDHPSADPFIPAGGASAKGRLKVRPDVGIARAGAVLVETT